MPHTLRLLAASLVILLSGLCRMVNAQETAWSHFEGRWAFELPDGNPAWLKLSESADGRVGSLLWSVGSARPVNNLKLVNGHLSFERRIRWQPYGKPTNAQVIRGPLTAGLQQGALMLTFRQSPEGQPQRLETVRLKGKKLPPLPPAPDLNTIRFGPPIELFDGQSLDGWQLTNPDKKNGWRAADGELINETPKTNFSAYGEYGNLATRRLFRDFRLSIEYNVPAGGNSGVYLRGMYEAQVVDRDSKMQGIAGPGAIFGRIAPARNAGRPGGEWNQYVLTLVNRHVTVELNGSVVISNQPLEGCTGGGLSADDTAPGPIFLQGDHTSVRYRRIRLEPVLRSATEPPTDP